MKYFLLTNCTDSLKRNENSYPPNKTVQFYVPTDTMWKSKILKYGYNKTGIEYLTEKNEEISRRKAHTNIWRLK